MKAMDAHLATTQWAQGREHFVNAGNQNGPQIVGRSLGWCGVGRGCDLLPSSVSVVADVPRPVLVDSACAAADGVGAPRAIAVTAALSGEFGVNTPKWRYQGGNTVNQFQWCEGSAHLL